MRSLFFLLALVGLLGTLAACGDERAPRTHRLEVEESESNPAGDAVEIAYAFEDGEVWEAELVLDALQTQQRTDHAKKSTAGAKSTFSLIQSYRTDGELGRSNTVLEYMQIHDTDGRPVKPPPGQTEATFRHGSGGRPDPKSLLVTGEHLAEAQSLFRSLLLAGLAGTESWVPDRPVKEGEVWRASETIDPQMVKAISIVGMRPGTRLPPAKLHGTIQLERVERTPQGNYLHLHADLLIELEGETWSDQRQGYMSTGYRVVGFAKVDQRTGLPVELDTRATMESNETMAGETFAARLELSLRGTAKRKPQ